jgi:hypothetical protein
MPEIRWTGGSLVHNKDTVLSDTLRGDRMVDDIAEVMAHAEGDLNMELTFGLDATPDPVEQGLIMEGVLGDDIVQIDQSYTVDTNQAGKTYTDSGATFITDGFRVGMSVSWSGFTNADSNGVHTISVLTETVMTVLEALGANESTVSADCTTNSIRNGIEKKSYLLEMEFDDVTQFMSFRGMRVNRMEINVTAGQIATCSFNFMGQQGIIAQTTVAGSTANPPSYSVMNATSNVGTLYEGGTALATAIRSIAITVDNAGRNLPAVANPYAIGINYGRQSVTGTMEAYFEDEVFLEKYIDHTETSLVVPFTDLAGNSIVFNIPSMYFSEGSPNVPGIDDEVMQTLNFSARREPTDQLYQIECCYLPA